MGNINDYMTSREAATELGLSKSRVDQYVRDGRLTAVMMGNARLIPRAEVAALKKLPRAAGRPKGEKQSTGSNKSVAKKNDIKP